MALSKITNTWGDYLQLLETDPVRTKSLTSATLSVASDVLAHSLSGKPMSTINLTSLRHQFLIGLLIRGPVIHYWYKLLDLFFARLGYSSASSKKLPSVVLGKVLLDQTVFSIPFNALYFFVIGFLNGQSIAQIKEKLGREFVGLMMANYKVWPLVNLLNFALVPPQLNVLFGNLVGVLWTAYVIQMTGGKK